jgi:cellulose synthase/poly-beta-1,6-N-acetylglucosamine synthase-like glycosyltransferase
MMLIVYILAGIYALLLLLYLFGWLRLKSFDSFETCLDTKFTVIVPVRNEKENIPSLFTDLSRQNYPQENLEIVIVDDHSEDGSLEIIQQILEEKRYPGVKLLQLKDSPNKAKGKKAAITFGISHSRNDWIICTDADCQMRNSWLSSISAFIHKENPDFISAPVLFSNESSVFQRMQSIEFLSLIGIGASTISLGYPTMCNGANMAFRKSVFQEVGGYAGNEDVASGDDEFLMHKISRHNKQGVKFLKSKEAMVTTQALSSWKAFWQQRKRWVSKGSDYKNSVERGMQVFVWFYHLAILISGVMAAFDPDLLTAFLILFVVKIGAESLFVIPVSAFFGKVGLWLCHLLASPFYVLYVVFIAIAGSFGKTTWKGRRI